MSDSVRKFTMTPQRIRAAILIAEDELSMVEIAAAVGVTDRSLRRWQEYPEFAAKVTEHLAELESAMQRFSIAKRRNRVRALDDRWQRMQRLIAARSEELAEQVAGGETGLLVHQERAIGTGANQQIIDEYVVDTGLLKELRAHEEQAAKELGQWVEKGEQRHEMIVREYVGVDLDRV